MLGPQTHSDKAAFSMVVGVVKQGRYARTASSLPTVPAPAHFPSLVFKVYNLANRYFEHIIINDCIRVSQGASQGIENGCEGTTDKKVRQFSLFCLAIVVTFSERFNIHSYYNPS